MPKGTKYRKSFRLLHEQAEIVYYSESLAGTLFSLGWSTQFDGFPQGSECNQVTTNLLGCEPMSRFGDYNAQNIAEFRKNHGKVGGYFEGAPLLLLHTIGRRSGRLHITPVMYLKDGESLLVFASKGGAERHPDWYFNLKAHPDFQMEVGDETVDVHAEEVTGGERDALYSRQAMLYPRFGDYQRKTKRIIPVIALTRRE